MAKSNPVFQAEHRYQMGLHRVRHVQVLRITLKFAVIFTVVLLLATIFKNLISELSGTSDFHVDALFLVLAERSILLTSALIIIVHIITLAHTLQLAGSSIVREKEAGTWETLLLTNVHVRRYVRGKWSATFTVIDEFYKPLFRWRLAAIFLLLCLELQTPPSHYSHILLLITGSALIPAYNYVGIGIAAALGVLSSILTRNTGTAYRLAIGFHLIYLLLTLLGFLLIAFSIPFLSIAFSSFLLAPFDLGIISALSILNTNADSSMIGIWIILVALYAALNGAVVEVILRITQRYAIRQGMLPPP